MQQAPIITFRGLDHSDALDADIREHIARLETYYDAIMGCRVIVEPLQRHHRTGNRYHVRIDLTVPGEEIVVSHSPTLHGSAQSARLAKTSKEDETGPERKHAQVAVREAFDIARRQLQDYARRQRGDVKTPAGPPHGRIVRLLPEEGYGFIEAEDGHEVYFQRTSLLGDDFDRLMVDREVSFVEEAGEKGPQASTVRTAGSVRRKGARAHQT